MNDNDPVPIKPGRIVLVITVHEPVSTGDTPQTDVIIGDGFEEHRRPVADLLATIGARWRAGYDAETRQDHFDLCPGPAPPATSHDPMRSTCPECAP